MHLDSTQALENANRYRGGHSRRGRTLPIAAGLMLGLAAVSPPMGSGQEDAEEETPASRKLEIASVNAIPEPQAPEPAEGTAAAHVVATMRALQRGDVDAFVAGFDATPDEVAMLTAIAGFSRSALEFRGKYVDCYGVEYWNAFQNTEDPAGVFDFHFTHVLDEHIESLKRLNNAELERERVVRLPNTGADTVVLANENGDGWLIDATPLVPAGFTTTAFAELMDRMSRMVSRYSKALGKESVDPRDLDFDMGRAEAEIFHQAIHGEPLPGDAPPARLDLDQLLAADPTTDKPAPKEGDAGR